MKITTITPLHNGAPWIAETLESLLSQALRPAEIIVVDDGSTDGSADIVRRFSSVRLLQNPGRGAQAARQFGFEQSRHELVAMIDQDDLWHREHLACLASVLSDHEEHPAALAGAMRFSADRPPDFDPWGRTTMRVDPWSVFPYNPIPSRAQVLFRREVLMAHGGWPTRFPGLADFQAWLTLSARRPFLAAAARTVALRSQPPATGPATRRRNRWEYCDRYLSAAQERVPLRLRYHPADARRIRHRLKTARHVFAWRFADAMLSPRQSAPLALQVDKLLTDATEEDQQLLLDQALNFFPVDEHPTRLRKTVGLLRLWRRCPREARHLRAALRRHVQRRVAHLKPLENGAT